MTEQICYGFSSKTNNSILVTTYSGSADKNGDWDHTHRGDILVFRDRVELVEECDRNFCIKTNKFSSLLDKPDVTLCGELFNLIFSNLFKLPSILETD